MEPDFSGWATKADLQCADGRTIMREAFAHQDGMQVPLVWQHSHNDPTNVLGYVILHARPEGVWADAYCNNTASGLNAKALVQHKDVDQFSIYANKLVERGKQVFHGFIREVSLVLSGANPGARIEQVRLAHGDGIFEDLDEDAVIYTGLSLTHSADAVVDDEVDVEEDDENLEHADGSGKTVQDVYDELTDEQKMAVNYMLGAALEAAAGNSASAEHSNTESEDDNESDDEESDDEESDDDLAHTEEGITDMSRNVFETHASNTAVAERPRATLTHDQLKTIVQDGQRLGSLKESFLAHAGDYGIDDIEFLFPDAKNVTDRPELIARRTEWVAGVLDGAKHTPFSRIKSLAADLTADEARAKGYVKGNLKKEEVIKLLKRVTTPTTVYKKQKLDRDDIVDITTIDVVSWLKWEMRFMLEEELARAILIGDGREPDDEDKIDEDHLRPIAFDDDMYAHKVNLASNVSPEEIVEGVIRARKNYKGTGTPTFYTTDDIITDLLLIKNKIGSFVYESEAVLASKLRVKELVAVEVMESEPDILGIMVNIADYTIGADNGGQLAMFDDFDIDYNQQKYLIETRISGALTKPKSAVVVKRVSGTLVTATAPTYNSTTHVITIPSVTGVTYYDVTDIESESVMTSGTHTITATTEVEARANTGYSFAHGTDNDWTFTYVA